MAIQENHQNFSTQWLTMLTGRFTEIAARRVPENVLEDIVQDAMGIVLTKGVAEARRQQSAEPPLRWCFLVLRNVIGNYYQKRRQHDSVSEMDLHDDRPDALAALTQDEKNRTIHRAMDQLRQGHPDCASWLWGLAQGRKPGALARKANMEEAAFYRRIYRCRKKLAAILVQKGVTS